jgi:hypothetical protein
MEVLNEKIWCHKGKNNVTQTFIGFKTQLRSLHEAPEKEGLHFDNLLDIDVRKIKANPAIHRLVLVGKRNDINVVKNHLEKEWEVNFELLE